MHGVCVCVSIYIYNSVLSFGGKDNTALHCWMMLAVENGCTIFNGGSGETVFVCLGED